MAPSDTAAIFAACSGVEMPKPTAHETSGLASFTNRTIATISVVISLLTPVTPKEMCIRDSNKGEITGAVDIDNMYEFASSHCDDFKDLRDDEDIVINREWILNKLAEAEN